MANILGLLHTERTDSWINQKVRRKLFSNAPQGAAQLAGFLSLIGDEVTPTTEYGWEEERYLPTRTITQQLGATGPFGTNASPSVAQANDFDLVAGDVFVLEVADATQFIPNDVILIHQLDVDGTATDVQFVVQSVNTTDSQLTLRAQGTVTNIDNTTAANALNVTMIGNANREGDRSSYGKMKFPIEIYNYTQILRHPVEFARSVLKAGLRFDADGVWGKKVRDMHLAHSEAMEMAFLFGTKAKNLVARFDGRLTQERTTGGVQYFLQQWEAADSTYRGGTGAAAVTANTDDNKRIINLTGNVDADEFDGYIRRAFKRTNNQNFEKLVFCDGVALAAFNRYVDRRALKTTSLTAKGAFGINMTQWTTPWGDLFFKTHPLLNENPAFNGVMLILDLGNLKYRYLTDSDTEFLDNRQENDLDGLKQEWITECGLECRFPESHMFIKGLTGII